MNKKLEHSFFHNLEEYFIKSGVENAEALMGFAERVFNLAPIEELVDEPVANICGLILSLRQYLDNFPGPRPKVRSFNPESESEGWEHPLTHVFVLQRDMAFLVDTVRMHLSDRGLGVHGINSTIFHVVRDQRGDLLEIAPTPRENSRPEALMYFQVDRYSAPDQHREVVADIIDVLEVVEVVNAGYQPSLQRLDGIIDAISRCSNEVGPEERAESLAFLEWVKGNHFTFLAYRYFSFSRGKDPIIRHIPDRDLGIFGHIGEQLGPVRLCDANPGIQAFYRDHHRAVLTRKSSIKSPVHRDSYCDYIIVKDLDKDGQCIGEHRFLGLYTSLVYSQSPFEIPLIRQKLNVIFARSGLNPSGHYGKALRQVMETHPREELIHSSEDQLYETLIGIWQINERWQVRLFTRSDPYGEFFNCLVYFPRDTYRTEVRERTQALLMKAVEAIHCDFYTYFTQSLLVRTHFVMRIDSDAYRNIDVRELERQIADIAQDWRDDLREAVIDYWGEERGVEFARIYRDAFSVSYQAHFDPATAVQDIELLHELSGDEIAIRFFQPEGAEEGIMRLKVFHRGESLSLSRMVPMLENLGFTVLGEHPYPVYPKDATVVWVHDFSLRFSLHIPIDVPGVRDNFIAAFKAIWHGKTDDDTFNWLVIGARLDWRSVALVRTYARYMKQLGIPLSQHFIAATLAQNLEITRNLIALFKCCQEPRIAGGESDRSERGLRLEAKVIDALEGVRNLNQDQVLRTILGLISATMRSNFFQFDDNGEPKSYITIKLSPSRLAFVPSPRPEYEIFVYSPRFEGVHLRAGKVARGGIRWSDRVEDYRTEILGLVKAQQVKNAVIVPTGAKGGFVVKDVSVETDRSAFLAEGKACYLLFMGALLDVTDNIVDGDVVPPKDVVRIDGDDPYLVVAADKGTATFSDFANEVSLKYKHWLGDAFASGGSNGYDHKKLGITARGAWVAVQRHFRELGLNTQTEDFTVIGIGDMSGDVFGNGMLLSPHIRLVAAFNHRNIFVDPEPDTAISYEERKRLFALPGSTWADYNPDLISRGGGVFPRDLKSIRLTPEMKQRFDISQDELTPSQFIKRLLMAPVDLVWNGGIGTYVKAIGEGHGEVGDRANDELRVNGRELRCRVFGEGGNLGMTQRGRIEFCLNGGACNTDFIDNSGGVDCSDQEVNIKIALNQLVVAGDMTFKQRNALLESMSEEVAEKVLLHNYRQTQNLSLAIHRSRENPSEFWHSLTDWESRGVIDRTLENLPDDETLQERGKSGYFMTRPELAVLLSYSKILFKQQLQGTDIDQDERISREVFRAFPPTLGELYPTALQNHALRREVLCNQLANEMIDFMGLTFVHRQIKATGAGAGEIARAYVITREVFDLEAVWREVESLDYKVPSDLQARLQLNLMRMGRRTTRWLLRNRRNCTDTEREIKLLKPILQGLLGSSMEDISLNRDQVAPEVPGLFDLGLSDYAAMLIDSASDLYFALGMADVSIRTGANMELVTDAYSQLGEILQLEWFIQQIIALASGNRWEDFARESFMDDLESLFRKLAIALLDGLDSSEALTGRIDAWQVERQAGLNRWQEMIQEFKSSADRKVAMFSVALRELADLVEGATGGVDAAACAT